jgi:hypothetical protein
MKVELQQHGEMLDLFGVEEVMALQLVIQTRVNSAWMHHGCCKQEGAAPKDSMLCALPDASKVVEVVFLGLSRCRVTLPSWRCQTCNHVVCATPITANCFPSTPCTPSMWLHQSVMRFYRQLGLHDGVSFKGETEGAKQLHVCSFVKRM